MIELLFEGFRRITESALEMQRDIFRHWSQQWLSVPLSTATRSTDWYRSLQRRGLEFTLAALHKNREALDAAYRSNIEMLEQLFRLTEATSPEDTRQIIEEFWRKLFGTFKVQSESQFRELQEWSAMSFEMVKPGRGEQANGKGQSA